MSVLRPGFRRPRGQVEREVVGGGASGSEERREDEQTEDGQEEARDRVTGADPAGGARGEVGRGGAEVVVRPSMACPQRLFWRHCCCHGSRPTSRWRRFTDSLRFRLKVQT